MEDLVEQYPQCLYFVDVMQRNEEYKNIRFKKLNIGYPMFVLNPHLFDEVDIVEFLEIEQNRLPLFIGSQFGKSPRLEEIYTVEDENRIIAVLRKSILSGTVAGLTIYLLKKNYELIEIENFKNIKQ
jgi:hypothetical protein